MLAVFQMSVLLVSFIYLIVIIILYYNKGRLPNIDTKLYSRILKITFFSLIIEFSLYFSALLLYPNGELGKELFYLHGKTFVIIIMVYGFVIKIENI